MSTILSGQFLGDRLCEALGLYSQKDMITGISIICNVGALAVVEVRRFVPDKSGALVAVLEEYELRQRVVTSESE